MKMIECLIEENSNLVQYLDQKNRDIQKMIESSALNESEEVQDLRHTNKLLIEENQILNKHIQDDRVLEEKL